MTEPGRISDALARMAKWEELRHRSAGPSGTAVGPAADAEPDLGRGNGPSAAAAPTGRAAPPSALDDLIQAIRDVAIRNPALSVAVIAQDAGVTWRLHTVRADGGVQVVTARTDAQLGVEHPAHPAVAAEPATAARLAEILRTNPTLLGE
jgi:hypothetical protein